jgi:hypothetical protein
VGPTGKPTGQSTPLPKKSSRHTDVFTNRKANVICNTLSHINPYTNTDSSPDKSADSNTYHDDDAVSDQGTS